MDLSLFIDCTGTSFLHSEMVSQTSAGGGMVSTCCISYQKPVDFDEGHK